jgi:hypothetical protein
VIQCAKNRDADKMVQVSHACKPNTKVDRKEDINRAVVACLHDKGKQLIQNWQLQWKYMKELWTIISKVKPRPGST